MSDPWVVLRRFTQARIGLGRCGSGLPTAALLELQLAHAKARDAVHVPWDLGRFAEEVRGLGVEPVTVESAVSERGEYLRRPDLGRKLTGASRERLAGLAGARSATRAAYLSFILTGTLRVLDPTMLLMLITPLSFLTRD